MSLGRVLLATFVAGMVGAVAEMAFVLPIQQFILGHSPMTVFRSIAVGALGPAALDEGLRSAVLGMVIHVLVSLGAAGVYVLIATRWRALILRPLASGVVFGAMVYVVMTFVVVPLSAIGFQPPKTTDLFAASFAIHLFAFGAPIALTARAMLTAPITKA
ncbi:MAG: hypothetical protein ACREEB_02495 [Caulobacteraceae bacterium]